MQGTRAKRYATVVATFASALAIGFVMQNGDVLASRLGVDASTSNVKSQSQPDYRPVTASGFVTPQARIDAETGITTESSGVNYPLDTVVPDMTAPPSDDGASLECGIGFEATPGIAAMVTLSLYAPCHPDTLVTVQHQGMKFVETTDGTGQMIIAVPALAKEAFFVATVAQTEGVVAITGVPDVGLYDRAVLQWRGDEQLQLHAQEFDADIGEEGHIWAASMGSPQDSADGTQGFITQLGTDQSTDPLMVEAYTYPTGSNQSDGDIKLTVRAEVTPSNCGRQVIAQGIQIRPDQPPAARRMTLRIPSCDNVGEFLVLKNMFEDLTLAAR